VIFDLDTVTWGRFNADKFGHRASSSFIKIVAREARIEPCQILSLREMTRALRRARQLMPRGTSPLEGWM
jgi:hypothetical protein